MHVAYEIGHVGFWPVIVLLVIAAAILISHFKTRGGLIELQQRVHGKVAVCGTSTLAGRICSERVAPEPSADGKTTTVTAG